MPDVKAQNRIFYSFSQVTVPFSELNFLNFVSEDNYEVFIAASLESSNIKNLKQYLELGLNEVKVLFNATDLPVLERMKESIYGAGDFLAGELLASKEVVDDADFSVAILAFKNDVMYVWMDGALNVRMYRDNQSLLLNEKEESQFWGSTAMLLGILLQ